MHVDNKNKKILVLGESPTQALDDTTTTKAKYPINFTHSGKRFVLSLHYNGSNSFLFVNDIKMYQFVFSLYFKRFYNQQHEEVQLFFLFIVMLLIRATF